MGRILRMGDGPGATGSFEAPVHDTGAVSRWGSLSWRADLQPGASIAFRTRSGNSAKPDRTWSSWSDALTDFQASRITSPNARYIQWKLELAGGPSAVPVVNSVTLSYLAAILRLFFTPSTLPRTLTVSYDYDAPFGIEPPPPYEAAVTVSDNDANADKATASVQTLPRAYTQQITVSLGRRRRR